MIHDTYTLRLLGMVVEAYPRGVEVYGPQGSSDEGWSVSVYPDGGRSSVEVVCPTLAEALSALLRDLGAKVPERPSAERLRAVRSGMEHPAGGFEDDVLDYLRGLYRREPLSVLALLEGEA